MEAPNLSQADDGVACRITIQSVVNKGPVDWKERRRA